MLFLLTSPSFPPEPLSQFPSFLPSYMVSPSSTHSSFVTTLPSPTSHTPVLTCFSLLITSICTTLDWRARVSKRFYARGNFLSRMSRMTVWNVCPSIAVYTWCHSVSTTLASSGLCIIGKQKKKWSPWVITKTKYWHGIFIIHWP